MFPEKLHSMKCTIGRRLRLHPTHRTEPFVTSTKSLYKKSPAGGFYNTSHCYVTGPVSVTGCSTELQLFKSVAGVVSVVNVVVC